MKTKQSKFKLSLPKFKDTRITPLFEITECCYKKEFESSYVILLVVSLITAIFIALKHTIFYTVMEYHRIIYHSLRDIRPVQGFYYFLYYEIMQTVFQFVHFVQLRYFWRYRAVTFVQILSCGIPFVILKKINRVSGSYSFFCWLGALSGYQKQFIPRLFSSMIPYQHQFQYSFLSQIISTLLAILLCFLSQQLFFNHFSTHDYPVYVVFAIFFIGFVLFLQFFKLLKDKFHKPYYYLTERFFNNQFNPYVKTQCYMSFKNYFNALRQFKAKQIFFIIGLSFTEHCVFGYTPSLGMFFKFFPHGQNVLFIAFVVSWSTMILSYPIYMLLHHLRLLSVSLLMLTIATIINFMIGQTQNYIEYYFFIFVQQLASSICKFEGNRIVDKKLYYPFTLTYSFMKQFASIISSLISMLSYVILRNSGIFGNVGMTIGMATPVFIGAFFIFLSIIF